MLINFSNKKIFAGVSEKSDGSMVWWNKLPVPENIKKNQENGRSGKVQRMQSKIVWKVA